MNLETLIGEEQIKARAYLEQFRNRKDNHITLDGILTTAMREAFEAGKEYAYRKANKALKSLIK